jgi:hypothetical protein
MKSIDWSVDNIFACRDAEMADVAKERAEQAKGPAAQAHELDELAKIYEDRGITPLLARKVYSQRQLGSFTSWNIGKF